MKKSFLSLLLFLLISNTVFTSNKYKSIEEVKSLNFELFEEIGLDDNKINYVSRVIYSSYKKAQHISDNGGTPQEASKLINSETKAMFLRVLSESEFKRLDSIKHKLK
tara:strand:+ start:359 stop:682 length:324 start_codon:yes stop_codon:yes gene_type:complete